MSTTDIRDELDRSFGDGPAPQALEVHLAAGHRALRRRRALVGAAAAAVVLIAGGSYAVASSGTTPDTDGRHVAVDPSEAPWQRAEIVRYADGALEVRPGVTVHQHLRNPFGYAAPDLSDALDVTFRGRRIWLLADLVDGRPSVLESVPSNGWAGFGAWVDDQVGQTGDGWPETVRLDAEGQVVAAPGAEIVQRTDDPRLGESFAPPDATTGAAVVVVEGEAPSYFVVWRVIDGELDVITTPPRDVVGATFDELLTYARAQYASGEGLR
jgi:hypothetical protein